MPDRYQIPALLLTTLLLPAFGGLYLRSRNIRTLLWFLALVFGATRMFLAYPLGIGGLSGGSHPWLAAAIEVCALLSSALFLGSLSPIRFQVKNIRILYVIPYIAPMIVYAILAHGVFRGVPPQGPIFWIFPALGVVSLGVALRWDLEKGNLPTGISTVACILFGGLALWFCFRQNLYSPLALAESGNYLVTALLVLFAFRRFSSGVVLSALGFALWSLPVLLLIPAIAANPLLSLSLIRMVILAKVVAAIGLILITLEDELAANKATTDRERRARKELEAYTGLDLTRRHVKDLDTLANQICQTVADYSRFSQAALMFLQPSGIYRLVGAAGFDRAIETSLGSLVSRIHVDNFPPEEFSEPALENSQTLRLNLDAWLTPGDDLRRLRLTSLLAIPLPGRESIDGALLLAGMRKDPSVPLRRDDLLPLEMFANRLQAARSQTRMLERLIDSEKFAGLGQLAGAVTQQLNNPLTVILGYASLLQETSRLPDHERKGIEAILGEARHMRSTLQSLARISHSPVGPRSPVSIQELVADLEQLHRSEFLQKSIEFRLSVPPALPRVLCHAQQLRQAVLHCLQFAMQAVENQNSTSDRTVRLEASTDGDRVRIMVAHSGPQFHHPERAFDPYHPPQAGGAETSGLGLSLCATILRQNEGSASAINLEPQGAAILLDLQAA